jgi:hypothetical protein
MRGRLRFCLKLTTALLTGAFVYQAAIDSPEIQELVLGCKALAIEKLGTAAQRERLIDDVGRAAAERDGTTDDHETTVAFS